MSNEARIVQAGVVVAAVDCPTEQQCSSEIWHYAQQYAEDGPLVIEMKKGRGWVKLMALAKAYV